MLFDISTAKIQCFHHKISFLEFSKFSEKLQMYVNILDTYETQGSVAFG